MRTIGETAAVVVTLAAVSADAHHGRDPINGIASRVSFSMSDQNVFHFITAMGARHPRGVVAVVEVQHEPRGVSALAARYEILAGRRDQRAIVRRADLLRLGLRA